MEQAAVQQEPNRAGAGPQHAWLRRLVGEWRVESFEEGAGPQPSDWTESVRSIGELWVQGEMGGTVPDSSRATNLITLGYDPARGRFVGTFVGSTMTHLWVYEGELEADGATLTLYAEGPDFQDPGVTRRYRDAVVLEGDDTRVLRSAVLEADGTWREFMSMRSRRVG